MMFSSRTASVVVLAFTAVAAVLPARADWRDDMRTLRIGIVAPDAAYRIAALQPFRAYLETRLGLSVEIVATPNYGTLINEQVAGRISYAIHSAASYVTTAATCRCVEPIGVPVASNGARGFYSVLVVRSGSGIKALADARSARLAVAGPDSVAGRLIPMKAFTHEGIAPQRFFTAIVERPDPEGAVEALFDGSADIAVAWSSLTGLPEAGYDFGVLTSMVAEGKLVPGALRVVWRSAMIPFGPHVVRSDMPAELKMLLAEALLAMASEDPDAVDAVDRLGFGGGGFAAADAALYAPVAELVEAPAEPGTPGEP